MSTLLPQVRNQRCARYRFRYSECQLCTDACPHEALTLSDEGVALDGSRCRNCELCIGACPTEVFAGGTSPTKLIRAALERKTLHVGCRPSESSGDETVGCLGSLDPIVLGSLARRGVAITLSGSTHCDQCAHAPQGAARLAAVLDGFALLRDNLGDERWTTIKVDTGESAGMDRQQASRRHFFGRMVGRAVVAATAPLEQDKVPALAVRAAPLFASLPRELLNNLVSSEATLPAHGTVNAGDLDIGAGCNGCELCFRVCPTGALQVSEQDAGWQLEFQNSRCVNCGVCVEACQPGALVAAEQIGSPRAEPRILVQRRRARCQHCGRIYMPSGSDEACPACRADDDDFAAVFG